jgi:hypothetical protein
MSTPFIRELLTRMEVRPKPLFHGDIDSNDSEVDDVNDGDATVAEETLATQVPEASGEGGDLTPSIGAVGPLGVSGYEGTVGRGSKGGKGMSQWPRSPKLTNCL